MKKTVIISIFIIISSCGVLRNNRPNKIIITRGYYFIIQIHSIKKDTISFEAIEIYSPSPLYKISNLYDVNSDVEMIKLPIYKFKHGYLKGVNKKMIGNVFLLYTNDDSISADNFVTFDHIDHLNWTFLSNMFKIGDHLKKE